MIFNGFQSHWGQRDSAIQAAPKLHMSFTNARWSQESEENGHKHPLACRKHGAQNNSVLAVSPAGWLIGVHPLGDSGFSYAGTLDEALPRLSLVCRPLLSLEGDLA